MTEHGLDDLWAKAEKDDDFLALAASVAPLPPRSGRRELLLAAIEARPWEPFVNRVAVLIDVSAEKAASYLNSMLDKFVPAPWTNVEWIHLEAGPATAGCDVGILRVAPEQEFPFHTHGGEEVILVLQGGYQNDDGSVHRAGDLCRQREGHSFTALPGQPLIYLVVVPGVEFPEAS
ncbi:MAG TPA: cupin domain-containing protein [Myxococcota bacterium]|nr:cupin domain-containing protein [Myxococcota bacterium]